MALSCTKVVCCYKFTHVANRLVGVNLHKKREIGEMFDSTPITHAGLYAYLGDIIRSCKNFLNPIVAALADTAYLIVAVYLYKHTLPNFQIFH